MVKAIMHKIDTTPGLHKFDSLHLTTFGNAIFLNTMQEAFMSFLIIQAEEPKMLTRKKEFTQPPFIYAMIALAFFLQLWPLNWRTNSEFLIRIACYMDYFLNLLWWNSGGVCVLK